MPAVREHMVYPGSKGNGGFSCHSGLDLRSSSLSPAQHNPIPEVLNFFRLGFLFLNYLCGVHPITFCSPSLSYPRPLQTLQSHRDSGSQPPPPQLSLHAFWEPRPQQDLVGHCLPICEPHREVYRNQWPLNGTLVQNSSCAVAFITRCWYWDSAALARKLSTGEHAKGALTRRAENPFWNSVLYGEACGCLRCRNKQCIWFSLKELIIPSSQTNGTGTTLYH